jgi:hypothetical protein
MAAAGITVESLARLPAAVRGWVFQQLVKYGAALRFADLSPLFLVWDSDLIPLKPIPLFGYVSSLDQVVATCIHLPRARRRRCSRQSMLTPQPL